MVIFLRHSETVYNKEHRLQGISNSPLTQAGIEQATAMGQLLSSYHPVKYFLSPLPRVYETFFYIQKTSPADYEIDPNLSEISYGSWETKDKKETSTYPEWKNREKNRFFFVHPGQYKGKQGESYEILYKRLITFFHTIAETYQRENAVVIAHQGVMVAAKKYYEHVSDEEISHFRLPNDKAICVKVHQGSYIVTELTI